MSRTSFSSFINIFLVFTLCLPNMLLRDIILGKKVPSEKILVLRLLTKMISLADNRMQAFQDAMKPLQNHCFFVTNTSELTHLAHTAHSQMAEVLDQRRSAQEKNDIDVKQIQSQNQTTHLASAAPNTFAAYLSKRSHSPIPPQNPSHGLT